MRDEISECHFGSASSMVGWSWVWYFSIANGDCPAILFKKNGGILVLKSLFQHDVRYVHSPPYFGTMTCVSLSRSEDHLLFFRDSYALSQATGHHYLDSPIGHLVLSLPPSLLAMSSKTCANRLLKPETIGAVIF